MTVDLSFAALFRSAAGYRVTGQFEGVDLVNGGKHEATDVGNFGMNDPILGPINGMARGMRHFDGALGVDYDIGNGWHVQLWHLNATQAPLDTWVPVAKGQICGRTGNTGALVNGNPMPAHTHVELERAGVRYDIEPYLLGKPFETGEIGEDDVQYPRPMFPLALVTVAAGNNLRRTPSLTAEAKLLTVDATVGVHGVVTGERWISGGVDKGPEWLWVGYQREMWCVHSALVGKLTPTVTLQTLGLAGGDCSAQDAKLTEARLGVAALRGQHTEEGAALEGVARALGA